MNEICTDNRFDLIATYKRDLLNCTNIETSPDEMAVIDNILFRFWQMGWFLPTPRTNADRIRAMTDEKLAEFMNRYDCPPTRQGSICLRPSERCDNCWLNWLKQEIQE